MIKTVTPKEAKELIDAKGYRYVDVRSEWEFEQGHPEGAVNIPILHMSPGSGPEPNARFLDVVEANFDKDARIVVGCKSGGRSHRAAEKLVAAGFTDIVNMDGGFSGRYDQLNQLVQPGWTQEELPVSDETGDGVSYKSLAAKAS